MLKRHAEPKSWQIPLGGWASKYPLNSAPFGPSGSVHSYKSPTFSNYFRNKTRPQTLHVYAIAHIYIIYAYIGVNVWGLIPCQHVSQALTISQERLNLMAENAVVIAVPCLGRLHGSPTALVRKRSKNCWRPFFSGFVRACFTCGDSKKIKQVYQQTV